MKKRVLFYSEASFLNTGYASYSREILKRLYKTDKYIIAEHASYARNDDVRLKNIPWKVYCNLPEVDASPEENQRYNAETHNQFGKWRFDDVILDFKPDVVLMIRDDWMDNYVVHSPGRPYYKVIWMPTVDSPNQNDGWLANYLMADKTLTYTDWGMETLKNEAGLQPQFGTAAHAGTDVNVFKPIADKAAHRQTCGMSGNSFIIGSIMRNQKRKLLPDLLQAFSDFLLKCKEEGNDELAMRSYLYLHTSYPDVGWDIPRLIKNYGLGHKVLFTYICNSCMAAFPFFFQDSRTTCIQCGKPTAILPNTKVGIPAEQLPNIYNTFDVYVQYANSEGIGIPAAEAASCGVPVMVVNFSGMTDYVNDIGAIPINVLDEECESETHCYRARPDSKDFVNKLYEFALRPATLQQKKGAIARQGIVNKYNYDDTAKIWENEIDNIGGGRWDIPPRTHTPDLNMPPNLTNYQFMVWAFTKILGRPEQVSSYVFLRLLKDLNMGFTQAFGEISVSEDTILNDRQKMAEVNRETIAKQLLDQCMKNNAFEMARANNSKASWIVKQNVGLPERG